MKSETKIRPKIICVSNLLHHQPCQGPVCSSTNPESAGAEPVLLWDALPDSPVQPGLLCSAAAPSILLSVYLLLMNGAQLISLMDRMPVGKHIKGFKSLSLLQESFSLQCKKGS